MSSRTQIANLAYTRIGVTKQIANVDTERSPEAIAAKLIFEDERDYCLRDFPWPWATAYQTLGLVAGAPSAPVNTDWRYAYRYPSDCVFARRILSGRGRNDPNPIPFRIGRDEQGRLIYTNQEDAQLEYTARVEAIEEFDALFVSMLAWKMGASLSPGRSRIKGITEKCMDMYELDKSKAQSRALNEAQQDEPAESEAVRARA
jgi:hypothetical protein